MIINRALSFYASLDVLEKVSGYNIPSGSTAELEINGVLSDQFQVTVLDDDPDYFKYSTVKGDAYFECSKCNFRWSSHNGTIKIDLYNQKVLKKYKQRCYECGGYWAVPCFKSNRFKRIVQKIGHHLQKMKFFNEEWFTPPYLNEETSCDHDEAYCERCIELGAPCCVIQRGKKEQDMIDQSPVYSIFRQLSHVMACYIQKHPQPLHNSLKDLFVKINIHIDDQCGFIHLIPTERSIGIVHWNKLCEEKLESFLSKLNSVSLSIQPEISPKLQEITKEVNSKASLCLKEQTLLQIVGFREEVEEFVEFIEEIKAIEYKQKKNCIIPF